MSFEALIQSDIQPKKKQIEIEINGNKYDFTANEISYFQRLRLAVLERDGKDAMINLVVFSVTDKDGKHMSLDQAYRLPNDVALKFFNAASEVNELREEDQKN